jgi:hypothetical protein
MREYLDLKDIKRPEVWKNLIKRGFVIYTFHTMLLDSKVGSRVEAGSNTSIVTLRVVRRRWRKWKSQIWDNKIWMRVPRDSDPKMTALARTSSNCKRQTRPLVRDNAPNQQTRKCLTVIKIWSYAPDGRFIPR